MVLVFGRSFFINAWKQAKHRSANMDTLVALSTGMAYGFSVFWLPLSQSIAGETPAAYVSRVTRLKLEASLERLGRRHPG